MGLSSWALVLCAATALCLASCEKASGVADLIEEARVQQFQGRTDEAIALYEQVLEQEAENTDALLGLTNLHIGANDLEAARIRFETLEGLELTPRDAQLVEQTRLRLYGLIYEEAKGDGPYAPADGEQYETALIALYNAEPNEERALEIANRFAFLARQALGVHDPTQPTSQSREALAGATDTQLTAALSGYGRFTERDPRLRRVLNPPDAIEAEATAMVALIEEELFLREFARQFQATKREELIALEGFLPDTNMLRIFLQDQYQGPDLEGDSLEQFRDTQALRIVMDNLNGLAYQVRGAAMEGYPMPPAILYGENQAEVAGFFEGYQIANFEMTRRGQVTLEVLIPIDLLYKAAYRQEEFIAYVRNRRAQEGTGSAAEPEEGTGAPAPE